jgi:hypothetical protein
MIEKESKRYEEIESKIEKSLSPYITVKIPLPEGADKEAFLKLEVDEKFVESLKNYAKKWLKQQKK